MENTYLQHNEMFKLLMGEGDGILSTISVDVGGYPFGSATPYCLDRDFVPNILISSIAQHTKNIRANNKVSLTISQRSSLTNKQAQGRLTYIGDAVKVLESEDIKQRYISYFPGSKDYFKTHDFAFYKIQAVRLRYIGGFGKIYWVENESLKLKNIFPGDEEARIVKHMNDDHGGNLKDYVRFYLKQAVGEGDLVRMCGMDQYGVDLAVNEVKERILFPETLASSGDARTVFVQMAKACKG